MSEETIILNEQGKEIDIINLKIGNLVKVIYDGDQRESNPLYIPTCIKIIVQE